MTARGGGDGDEESEKERTRVAFVREVEVLRVSPCLVLDLWRVYRVR